VFIRMSKSLKRESESNYRLRARARKGIDREPYGLRHSTVVIKFKPESSHSGSDDESDSYVSLSSEESSTTATNKDDVVTHMLQLLFEDRQKERERRKAVQEERKLEQESAARERKRPEAFLWDLSETQAVQSERLQKANKTAQHVATIPVWSWEMS